MFNQNRPDHRRVIGVAELRDCIRDDVKLTVGV
jgi:hypothetical protein